MLHMCFFLIFFIYIYFNIYIFLSFELSFISLCNSLEIQPFKIL